MTIQGHNIQIYNSSNTSEQTKVYQILFQEVHASQEYLPFQTWVNHHKKIEKII